MINNSILIAEDDVLISEHLKRIVLNLGFEVYGIVASFDSASKTIDKSNLPDLALLDIRMHNEDQGLLIAKYLNKLKVPFIFITSFSDKKTLEEAVVLKPSGYIVKPFTPEEIKKSIESVLQKLVLSYIVVKHKKEQKKILFNDIIFIKSDNNYLEIHTSYSKIYLIRTKLSEIEKNIHLHGYVRVHRSFLVNKIFVNGINGNSIIVNHKELPVSRHYKKNLKSLFQNN